MFIIIQKFIHKLRTALNQQSKTIIMCLAFTLPFIDSSLICVNFRLLFDFSTILFYFVHILYTCHLLFRYHVKTSQNCTQNSIDRWRQQKHLFKKCVRTKVVNLLILQKKNTIFINSRVGHSHVPSKTKNKL